MNKKIDFKEFLTLHVMLMIYSTCGICSKMASNEAFLSYRFCIYYALVILLLGFYAVGWQQIIKRMDLTLAYSNKAVTVVWGIIWGRLFFDEAITIKKIIGSAIVISGVILYSLADRQTNQTSGI